MLKTKKLFVLVFLLLNCILFSACSQSKEVDFVKKYKIDLNTISDVTEVLQKAIDELPDDGVLFLQDGTYPLAGRIVFKENITFKLSDNAILLNCSQDKNPMMAYNHPYQAKKWGKLYLSFNPVRDPWGSYQPMTVHFSHPHLLLPKPV